MDEFDDYEEEMFEHDEQIRANDYRSLQGYIDNGDDFASLSKQVVSLGMPVNKHGITTIEATVNDYHPNFEGHDGDILNVSCTYDPNDDDVLWTVSIGRYRGFSSPDIIFKGSYKSLVNRLKGKE